MTQLGWTPCSIDGCADETSRVDLESLLLHELGHVVGLGHSAVPGAVMEEQPIPPCDLQRSLHADDIAGLVALIEPDAPRLSHGELHSGSSSLSVMNTGNLAYTGTGAVDGSGGGLYGTGYQFPVGTQNIFEASIAFARGTGPVCDDFRFGDLTEGQANCFDTVSGLNFYDGGNILQGATRLIRSGDVSVSAVSQVVAGTSDSFQLCYFVRNEGQEDLNDLRFGIFIDWDLAGRVQTNSTSWTNGIGIITDAVTPNHVCGIALVDAAQQQSAVFRTDLGHPDDVTWFAERKRGLLFGTGPANETDAGDVITSLSTLVDIPSGDQVVIGFVIAGGSNVNAVTNRIAAVRSEWENTCGTTAVAIPDVFDAPTSTLSMRVLGVQPFSQTCRFQVRVDGVRFVEVGVYGSDGRRVTSIARRPMRGDHVLSWDGRDDGGRLLASGVYFVKASADGDEVGRKVVLVR